MTWESTTISIRRPWTNGALRLDDRSVDGLEPV